MIHRMSMNRMSFVPVKTNHVRQIKDWLHRPHVQPYFYGEGLQNTLRNLDLFANGMTRCETYSFEHWIGYLDEKPFAFLMTSRIEGPYNPDDPYDKWYEKGTEAITLDLLIGEEDLLGKGLATPMIRQFLLDHYSHISKVLIDPVETNQRAIHVYEKAGFRKIEKFPQSHDEPHLCWMMHLEM